MAKIERYLGNLEAFASNASTGERTLFGSEDTGDALTENINAEFLSGWGIVGINENPTKQDFNALGYTLGRLLSYLHQTGIAEWDDEQEYHDGSFVNRGGVLYVCLSDDHTSATPPESDTTNWKMLSADSISYDNTDSDLDATTSQGAIDEINGRQAVPTGAVSPFAMSTAPDGWIQCDGSDLSRTTYDDLFAAIGETWGAGDGSTTFAIPDLRGLALEGTGAHGSATKSDGTAYSGATIGSVKNDRMQQIVGSITTKRWGRPDLALSKTGAFYGSYVGTSAGGQDSGYGNALQIDFNSTYSLNARTDAYTTGPRIGVQYCIKY